MYDWRTANDLLRRALTTTAWITTTFIDDTEHFPEPPTDFVKAWLHLHTAIILLSLPWQRLDHNATNHEAAIRHLSLFVTCLESGDEALVKQLRSADIKTRECAQANGVFWLSLSRLMSEELGTSVAIADTYRQYLFSLVRDALMKIAKHTECLRTSKSPTAQRTAGYKNACACSGKKWKVYEAFSTGISRPSPKQERPKAWV